MAGESFEVSLDQPCFDWEKRDSRPPGKFKSRREAALYVRGVDKTFNQMHTVTAETRSLWSLSCLLKLKLASSGNLPANYAAGWLMDKPTLELGENPYELPDRHLSVIGLVRHVSEVVPFDYKYVPSDDSIQSMKVNTIHDRDREGLQQELEDELRAQRAANGDASPDMMAEEDDVMPPEVPDRVEKKLTMDDVLNNAYGQHALGRPTLPTQISRQQWHNTGGVGARTTNTITPAWDGGQQVPQNPATDNAPKSAQPTPRSTVTRPTNGRKVVERNV